MQVDNLSLNALCDSGATLNVLSESCFTRLINFTEVISPNFQLKAITGIDISTGKVINFSVVIKDVHFNLNCVVARGTLSPNFDLILGLDFLERYKFTIDCSNCTIVNDSVSISYRANAQEVYPTQNFPHVDNCNFLFGSLPQKARIPPRCQKLLKIKIPDPSLVGETVLAQPNDTLNLNSYLIANSVAHIDKNSECLIQVINLTDDVITLNKSSKLVKIMPILLNCNQSNVNAVTTEENDDDSWCQEIDLSHLQGPQRDQVLNLLKKYKNVFAKSLNDLGTCSILQHRIRLTDDVPTRQKPYRVPYNLKPEMRRQIETLLDAGIIQPSTSPYAAPVLLVKKSDGTYRLCADLRKLNAKTLPDSFPLPNLQEMIDLLAGAKFFSSLDLTSGFHQMLMHPDDAHLTGISTDFGLYQFQRMPFGLKNASASFQRLMSIVLSGLSDFQIGVYIDDVVIASSTFEQHLQRLELVFQRLEQANLKLKPKKCSLLKPEIVYLGHRVTEGKVMPDPKNLTSIKSARAPTSKKQVRSFLGLTGFYRKFIQNYSQIALPLTNLTKDSVKFQWSEDADKAFETLKSCLIQEPCLALPNFERPFALCTDASKYALGAVLVQEDKTGFQHPVCFASRKLNNAEINYSVVEKEALAVVFGITHFKQYLYGTEFTVYTDQKSLSQLFTLKDPTSRIARWILTLQQYSYKVIHKPGRLNLMADFLSREVHALDCQPLGFSINSLSNECILKAQNEDDFCKLTVDKLVKGASNLHSVIQYSIVNDILVCKHLKSANPQDFKLVVPKSLVPEILSACHDNNTVAHPGFSRTLARVRENFFWKGMYKQVKRYVASCHSCIQRRGYDRNQKAPLQPVPTTSYPFQKCSIDAVGPFLTSKHGNKFLLVITDYFTRYPEAYPVKDIQSSTVASVLIDFISRHGLMDTLYSDRGSNFISQAMMEVCEKMGIKKRHTVSYNPQANGVVERLNKTLVDSLSHLVTESQEDWCEQVPLALLAFRTAYHRTIQNSPAFLVYGRDLVMPYDLIFSSKFRTYSDTRSYAQNLVINLQNTFELVKKNLVQAAKNQVNSQHSGNFTKFIQEGDTVYLHVPAIKPNLTKKLCKLNRGPYRVIKKVSPVLFEICLIKNPNDRQKVHVNRLIKVIEREPFPVCHSPPPETLLSPDQPISELTPESEEEREARLIKEYPMASLPLDMAWVDNQFTSPTTQVAGQQVSNGALQENFESWSDLSVSPVSFLQSPVSDRNTSPFPSFIYTPVLTESPPKLGSVSQHTYDLRPRDSNGFVIYNR